MNVVVLLALLSVAELSIAFLLNNPQLIPERWMPSFREYYMGKDRHVAQYAPDLAGYSSELFYALRPGHHSFTNREFDTEFTVSSRGFRDDEVSFNHPKIIVLGDSWAMGWGVNDNECFPYLLEEATGMRTLNTGVSSYGTAREMKVFGQLQKDSLKYLILQFDMNDNNENCEFSYHGNTFVPSSQEEYELVRDQHAAAIAYFPFKHVSHFVRRLLKDKFPNMLAEKQLDAPASDAQEEEERPYISPVDAFLNVLSHSALPDSLPILVFQVGNGGKDILIDPLLQRQSAGTLPFKNPVHIIDMQSYLNERDYYLLDGHLRPQGHHIVAEVLSAHITELETGERSFTP